VVFFRGDPNNRSWLGLPDAAVKESKESRQRQPSTTAAIAGARGRLTIQPAPANVKKRRTTFTNLPIALALIAVAQETGDFSLPRGFVSSASSRVTVAVRPVAGYGQSVLPIALRSQETRPDEGRGSGRERPCGCDGGRDRRFYGVRQPRGGHSIFSNGEQVLLPTREVP
jgi:hypothetical protein